MFSQRLAAVDRLVDAVAVADAALAVVLAGADPDDERVLRVERRRSRSSRSPASSKIGVQVVPAFIVFQTPPEADRDVPGGALGRVRRRCRRCGPRSAPARCRATRARRRSPGLSRLSGPACAADFAGAAGRALAGGAGLLPTSAAFTGRAARITSVSNAAGIRLIVLLPPSGWGLARRVARVPGTDGGHSRPCGRPGDTPAGGPERQKRDDERGAAPASAPGPDVLRWRPDPRPGRGRTHQQEPASGTP